MTNEFGVDGLAQQIADLKSRKETLSAEASGNLGFRLHELTLLIGYLRADNEARYAAFIEAMKQIKTLAPGEDRYGKALEAVEKSLTRAES